MTLNTIAELVFVIVMLLFFSLVVLSLLVIITVMQELTIIGIDLKIRIIFLLGMTACFFYIIKMVVDKIENCNRYT